MPGGPLHLYAATFLKKAQLTFEKGIVYEDLLFSALAYTRAQRVAVCDEALYFYRIRQNSTMTSKPRPFNLNCFSACIKHMSEEKKRYPKNSEQVEGLDLLIRHAAHELICLYGELDRAGRKECKPVIREVRDELGSVNTVGCRKQKIKYYLPGLWTVYYKVKKRCKTE